VEHGRALDGSLPDSSRGAGPGAVDIIYGFANGLSDFDSQAFSQDSNRMLGKAAAGDADISRWDAAAGAG
jgi:hypothetical protein